MFLIPFDFRLIHLFVNSFPVQPQMDSDLRQRVPVIAFRVTVNQHNFLTFQKNLMVIRKNKRSEVYGLVD